jgi:predicted nucleotidyltransferase component of viral defense system
VKIPLVNQLKKRQQVEIALLQDEIIRIIYLVAEDMVLHGDTAIWRCYSGKRFSEDLDFYSLSFPSVTKQFEKRVLSQGLKMEKIKDTGNVIFSSVSNGKTIVKLEVNHTRKVDGSITSYELVDGTGIEILSLTPDQLINEKIDAYTDRRYIRDLYDIHHLVKSGSILDSTKTRLRFFLQNIQHPVDESILKSIVYIGLAPTFDHMINEIGRSIT